MEGWYATAGDDGSRTAWSCAAVDEDRQAAACEGEKNEVGRTKSRAGGVVYGVVCILTAWK